MNKANVLKCHYATEMMIWREERTDTKEVICLVESMRLDVSFLFVCLFVLVCFSEVFGKNKRKTNNFFLEN